jgi:hypothetical protein
MDDGGIVDPEGLHKRSLVSLIKRLIDLFNQLLKRSFTLYEDS